MTALEFEASSSSCTYAVPTDTGTSGAAPEKKLENHYDLAESTLSNTYESVHVPGGQLGNYSEVVGNIIILYT